MRLWDRLFRQQQPARAASITAALQSVMPPAGTLGHDFRTYVEDGYKANGVVFACILARMSLFVEGPYCFLNPVTGEKTFDDRELQLLRFPGGPGETMRKMRARREVDLSLAGNSYIVRQRTPSGDRLVRKKPPWMQVVHTDEEETEVLGYIFRPGGVGGGKKPEVYLPGEVSHMWTIPDPDMAARGLSWLTPVAREVDADLSMSDHRRRFFNNAATPNLLVKLQGDLTKDQRDKLREEFDRRYGGTENAYKTMIVDLGADVEAIGHTFEQMSFVTTQAAGETKIAAAAGVPPIVAGLREGLQHATYSNYGQALRRFADGTLAQLWGHDADSMDTIITNPPGLRLWYDDRQIAALQQDKKDEAEIVRLQALAIASLVRTGYDVDTIAPSVVSGRLEELVHTGAIPNTLYLDPFVDAGGDTSSMNGDGERLAKALGVALPSAQERIPSDP